MTIAVVLLGSKTLGSTPPVSTGGFNIFSPLYQSTMEIFGMKKTNPSSFVKAKRAARRTKFVFKEPGTDKANVFAEEIFGEDEGDMPMNKPLVITKIERGKLVPVIGVQCVFIESAGKRFYAFKSILSGDLMFLKFKEVNNVYVIQDWKTAERDN